MARVVLRDEDPEKADAEAQKLSDVLHRTNEQLGLGAALTGPVPCPIERIGGYHRRQIELTAGSATAVQKLLGAVRDAGLIRSVAVTAVDVDPISLM
jgi:primosomal protein N'